MTSINAHFDILDSMNQLTYLSLDCNWKLEYQSRTCILLAVRQLCFPAQLYFQFTQQKLKAYSPSMQTGNRKTLSTCRLSFAVDSDRRCRNEFSK